MAQRTSSSQPHERFIDNGPDGPKPSARLSAKDKETLKPLLQKLHGRFANRQTMQWHSQILINRNVTLAQIDSLTKDMGLQRYKKYPNRRNIGPVDSQSLNDGAKVLRTESTTSCTERCVGETVNSIIRKPESSFGVTTSDGGPSALVVDDDESEALLEADTEHVVDGYHQIAIDIGAQARVHGSEQLLGTSSDTSRRPPHGCDTRVSNEDSLMIDGMAISLDRSSNGESTSEDQTGPGSCPNEPMVLSSNFSPLPPEISPKLDIDSVLFQIWWWPGNKGNLIDLPKLYRPSTSAFLILYHSLIQEGVIANTRITDTYIAQVNCTATYLHSLRAFDQAFDLYFVIYWHFLESKCDANPPHHQVVLGAINCARMAQTRLQVEVALTIIKDVRNKLRQYDDAGSLEYTQTWGCMRALFRRLSRTEDSMLRDLPVEPSEDVAYWMANALVMSRHSLACRFGTTPDYFMTFWQGRVLEHLYACETTRRSIFNGWRIVNSYVWKNSHRLGRLFGKYGFSSRKQTVRAAQAMSCLILEDCARDGTMSSAWLDSNQDHNNHHGLPCDLNGQAVAVIPFILVAWMQKYMVPSLPQAQYVEKMRLAVEYIQVGLTSGTAVHRNLIDLYISHMASPVSGKPESGGLFFAERLRGIAAGIAGILPISEVLVAAHVEDARKGIKIPETLSENEASTQLTTHRTSTSSLPTLALSYRSSNSSGFRSFTNTASRIRESIAFSVTTHQTHSSGKRTSSSSSRLPHFAGSPSDTSSRRPSVHTVSSDTDISMSG